jgi:hypothetical protein
MFLHTGGGPHGDNIPLIVVAVILVAVAFFVSRARR